MSSLLQVMKMTMMIKWIWLRLGFFLLLVTSKALSSPISPSASSQITLQPVLSRQFEGGCPNNCLNDLSMFCDLEVCHPCDQYCDKDKGRHKFSLVYCKSNCPALFNSMLTTLPTQTTVNPVMTAMATLPILTHVEKDNTEYHSVENHPQAGFTTDNHGIKVDHTTKDHAGRGAGRDAGQPIAKLNEWSITVIVISCVVGVALLCTMIVVIIIKLRKKYYTPCPSIENQDTTPDATARVARKGLIPNLEHICCACFTAERRPQEETELEPPKNT